jgi:hypothetical protein
VIHITFLLSALAIAGVDRLMPQPPQKHRVPEKHAELPGGLQ